MSPEAENTDPAFSKTAMAKWRWAIEKKKLPGREGRCPLASFLTDTGTIRVAQHGDLLTCTAPPPRLGTPVGSPGRVPSTTGCVWGPLANYPLLHSSDSIPCSKLWKTRCYGGWLQVDGTWGPSHLPREADIEAWLEH